MSPQRSRDASLGLRSRLARTRFTFIRRAFAAINPVLVLLAIVVVGTIAVAVLASSCSSDTANSSSTTASTSSAPTTTARPASSAPPATSPPATATTPEPTAPTGTDEEQIRATIDTYWAEWTRAIAIGDAESPALYGVLTGDAHAKVLREMQKKAALGQVAPRSSGGPVPHSTLSVAISGDEAVVRECVVDDAVLMDATTGATLNNLIESLVLEKTMVRVAGVWKISSSAEIRKVEGETRCLDE